MEAIIIWVMIAAIFALIFMGQIIFLIFISKKTHALIEFKSSMSGTPTSIFFQDNKYIEWRNSKPDAGMIEDKVHGSFIINSTYIDKKTKNVLIPFNSNFAISLNAKAVKMADDLIYVFKEKEHIKRLKEGIMNGTVQETDGIKTLRTTINFSTIKSFVPPILPHNLQSKIVTTVQLRMKELGGGLQNIILLVVSALGAMIMGGIILRLII